MSESPPPDAASVTTERHSESALVLAAEVSFAGPLPHPDILARYDQILPGAADRIIRMAERQADHRQLLERTVVQGDIRRAFAGVVAGFLVAIGVLGVAALLVLTGHDTTGLILAGGDVVALVGVFVFGSSQRRNERRDKAQAMMGSKVGSNEQE